MKTMKQNIIDAFFNTEGNDDKVDVRFEAYLGTKSLPSLLKLNLMAQDYAGSYVRMINEPLIEIACALGDECLKPSVRSVVKASARMDVVRSLVMSRSSTLADIPRSQLLTYLLHTAVLMFDYDRASSDYTIKRMVGDAKEAAAGTGELLKYRDTVRKMSEPQLHNLTGDKCYNMCFRLVRLLDSSGVSLSKLNTAHTVALLDAMKTYARAPLGFASFDVNIMRVLEAVDYNEALSASVAYASSTACDIIDGMCIDIASRNPTQHIMPQVHDDFLCEVLTLLSSKGMQHVSDEVSSLYTNYRKWRDGDKLDLDSNFTAALFDSFVSDVTNAAKQLKALDKRTPVSGRYSMSERKLLSDDVREDEQLVLTGDETRLLHTFVANTVSCSDNDITVGSLNCLPTETSTAIIRLLIKLGAKEGNV